MSKLPIITLTESKPTPLIRDFATFCQYLKTHKIILTATNEFISGKDLYELNQKMTYPLLDTTTRTYQTLYPLFHLLFHIALAGKLFRKFPGKGSKIVLKPTERLLLYKELKPTEKYFFLLETFWVDADWKKLQAGYFGHSPMNTVSGVLEFLSKQQPEKKIQVKVNRDSHISMILSDWEYFLHYFSFFGFWEVTRDKDLVAQQEPKRLFKAESITPSTFGVTIAEILSEARNLYYWNLPFRRKMGEWKAIPGSACYDENTKRFLKIKPKSNKSKTSIEIDKGKTGDPFFLPFIPLFAEGELQKSLPREGVKFVDGTYVFKASLSKNLWRTIEISADHTLLDLHNSIRNAYRFDDDHLYSFFMDGKLWSHECFTSPYDDQGINVDEVRIGELGLFVGQNILYLYDYGDMWRFEVKLEEIITESPKPQKPQVIEKIGKAPKQYVYFDE